MEKTVLIFIAIFLFLLFVISRQKKEKKEGLFDSKIFDYFAREHKLLLLSGEINDIKNEVYDGILNDLSWFSDNKLDEIFHGVIEEMNKRKAAREEEI